jgi:DNA polymerase-3 subunit delta'
LICRFVPGFDSIIDQERPIRILTSLLVNGTLPHALLFTGIEGVGKKTAAVALAMACNCTDRETGADGAAAPSPGVSQDHGGRAPRHPAGVSGRGHDQD